jgi:hypothetical protein
VHEPRLSTIYARQNISPTFGFLQLKLPQYETVELMRAKLLYAIHAGAGFELS